MNEDFELRFPNEFLALFGASSPEDFPAKFEAAFTRMLRGVEALEQKASARRELLNEIRALSAKADDTLAFLRGAVRSAAAEIAERKAEQICFNAGLGQPAKLTLRATWNV